tara:strand:- start:24343 stop:24486 length:144 start_codon:yes stop_codon:yes gene_type:complete
VVLYLLAMQKTGVQFTVGALIRCIQQGSKIHSIVPGKNRDKHKKKGE